MLFKNHKNFNIYSIELNNYYYSYINFYKNIIKVL